MDSREEIQKQVAEVLKTDYPVVRDIILKLETYLRTRSRRAVYELRDALDHIAAIYSPNTPEKDLPDHLSELKTHLRRASVEPMEYLVERLWLKADRILKRGFWWWPLLLLRTPNPAEREEIAKIHDEIINAIPDARSKKTSRQALPILLDAYTKSQNHLKRLQPNELWSRIFAGILFLSGITFPMILAATKQAYPQFKDWSEAHPFLSVGMFLGAVIVGVVGVPCLIWVIRGAFRKIKKKWNLWCDKPWAGLRDKDKPQT